MRFIILIIFMMLSAVSLNSQMIDGEHVKYGDEWIDLSREYYKIPVAEDGIYRISRQQLQAAGIPISSISGSEFQIYLYGQEIPMFTSTEGIFGVADYIEFYGEKNRSQLDKYLFRNRDHILNPEYSMFTDTASYFLSWTAGNGNGKRYTELQNDIPATPPEPMQYYFHEEKMVFNSDFIKPLRDPGNTVYRSNFDVGEGFGSRLQVENSFTISTSNFVNSGINPELSIRFATNIGRHQIEFRVNNELKKLYDQNSLNCEVMNITLEPSDMNSNIPVRITGTDDSDFLDRNSVSVVTLSYSREFKFQNRSFFRFNIEKSQFSEYMEISDFDMQGSNFVLYDINNNTRMIPIADDGKLKFVISPSATDRHFVLVNLDKNARTVSGMQKVEFKDYSQYYDRNYLVITDRERFYDESQLNWVDEYVRYRESPEGGSLKALVVNVQDIYDQFGYGIHRHAQAFNNFAIYYADHFINPEYIFIIGKGLEYHILRTEENLAANGDLLIVPTYGFPGADNLIAARYEKNHPGIAIGRIAARNHEEIKTYLGKIKRYDSYRSSSQNLDDRLWMKKVIHLVGGSDPSEVASIRTLMGLMENSLKNGKFAPNVVTYERTSGTAQETVSEKIINDIEEGAAIVTFFGHSSVTGDDFKVTRLNNEKLPVFFSLGCYSGNIHTTVSGGQSEFFIFDDNFMISYAGTSGTGFISALSNTGRTLYDLISNELYGSGIGKVMQRALQINDNNNSDAIVTLNQQFTLHGDPALSIYANEGPDFVIDYSSVRTEPAVISANDKDFKLVFDIVNIGLHSADTLEVLLVRTLPEERKDTISAGFKAPMARQSYEITLNTFQTEGTGQNCIAMFLNPDRKIPEAPDPAAFNNNTLRDQNGENRFCFFIINNGIRPVYPSEFSIVNNPELELIASTFNYFVENEKYVFQIDTTELFNSMLMRSNAVETSGGLVSWKPNISMEENTVYYWRVSPDSTGPETPFVWTNSSFIYLPESSEGWNQSHYYQWLKDEFDDLEFHEGRLDFSKWLRDFSFEIGALDPTNPNMVRRDGGTIAGLRPPPSLVPCVVLVSYGPRYDFYKNISGTDYGSKQYQPTSFLYKTDNLNNRKGIRDAIEAFPDSSIIFFYTYANGEIHSLLTEDWEADSVQLGYNIFSVFESYGAEYIRLLKTRGTVPYLFVFKKGGQVIYEDIGKSSNSLISVSIPVPERKWLGSLTSTLVGPAKEWSSVIWDESGKETSDNSEINIYKYNSDLTGKQLVGSLNSAYELDLSGIDPKEFPYVQLELKMEGSYTSRNTPDFNYWRVLYEGFPDAALVQDAHALFHSDTLEFGDIFRFRSGVINHTSIDMDSLLVRYRIRKQDNEEITVMKRYAPLKGGQGYNIDFEYPTTELAGMNEFTVEINADREQTEKYYFNNTGIRRFFVRQDNRNPVLDVTFDGIHIMDGDIINPSPAIRIMVRDDNKYLLLDDIGIFRQLTLISPSGIVTELPLVNNSEIEFVPAQSVTDNRAYLNFSPEFMEDGEYRMIVQTSDVSGNMSGSVEYRISFQVILKEQISDVYNYPNPFSTKTRFVFTLTGREVPEDIVIRIMTLSGKIVRELTSLDLGAFRIGQNITEKYWDGTDDFGSLLANGVYLYQVTAVNSAGEKFEKMETSSDTARFFKEGFGKLVILR